MTDSRLWPCRYYTKHFGMKQIRYRDIPDEKYTNAFLAPEGKTEDKHFVLELVSLQSPVQQALCFSWVLLTRFVLLQTKNYGVESYDIGTGFGHFALRVPDVYETVKSIKEAGEQPRAEKSSRAAPCSAAKPQQLQADAVCRRQRAKGCRACEGRHLCHRLCRGPHRHVRRCRQHCDVELWQQILAFCT